MELLGLVGVQLSTTYEPLLEYKFFRSQSLTRSLPKEAKEDKLKFLHDFNINIYIDFLFDHKLSEYSSFEFIKNILVDKLKIKNLVVGSDFGAATDELGRYFILDVPVGTYEVRAEYIGYKTYNESNVKTSVGFTT